ncbi:hypothetical protein AX16_004926 [Volvariella volvacea WC 439]|nr:hypothetical protein AX16_004926 [Volvariella volvacea WC 439]
MPGVQPTHADDLDYVSSDSDFDPNISDEDEDMEPTENQSDDEMNTTPDHHDGDLIPLEEGEGFASHFDEREGHLFIANGQVVSNPLYPLPVDGKEQKRVNYLHAILRAKIGQNYVGPVGDVLAPDNGRVKLVIDLGTGTGKWVTQMAAEFPHVQFRGVDAANAVFEIADIEQRLQFGNRAADIVHVRDLSMSIQNYPALLQEIARVLRPGGLLLAGEWAHTHAYRQDIQTQLFNTGHTPNTTAFFDTVNQYFGPRTAHTLQSLPLDLERLVQNTNNFHDIQTETYDIDLDPWHGVEDGDRWGRRFKRAHRIYGKSVQYLLRGRGMADVDVNALVTAYLNNLGGVGLIHKYHALFAYRN